MTGHEKLNFIADDIGRVRQPISWVMQLIRHLIGILEASCCVTSHASDINETWIKDSKRYSCPKPMHRNNKHYTIVLKQKKKQKQRQKSIEH